MPSTSSTKPVLFVSAREASRRIGKSHTAIASWAKTGKIPGAHQIGRSIMIPIEWVDMMTGRNDFLR